MGDSPGGRALVRLVGLLVLVLAVWTIRTTPALLWVAVLLGLPVAILTVMEALNPTSQSLVLWSSTTHAAFYFYTSYCLLRYMFNDRRVTTDELFATGATFTVVAWAFAYLYVGNPGHLAGVVHRRCSSQVSRGHGWSSSSCPSPTFRAPDSPTSRRFSPTPAHW